MLVSIHYVYKYISVSEFESHYTRGYDTQGKARPVRTGVGTLEGIRLSYYRHAENSGGDKANKGFKFSTAIASTVNSFLLSFLGGEDTFNCLGPKRLSHIVARLLEPGHVWWVKTVYNARGQALYPRADQLQQTRLFLLPRSVALDRNGIPLPTGRGGTMRGG